MKTFRYTCRDKDGRLKKGSLQAADRTEALSRLRRDGLVPVSVEASAGRPLAGGDAGRARRAAAYAALAVALAAPLRAATRDAPAVRPLMRRWPLPWPRPCGSR